MQGKAASFSLSVCPSFLIVCISFCLSSISNCLAVFTSYLSFSIYVLLSFYRVKFSSPSVYLLFGLSVGMFDFCKSVYVLDCLSFPFVILFVLIFVSNRSHWAQPISVCFYVCLFLCILLFVCLFVSFIFCWFVPICVIGSLTMDMEKLARTEDTMKNKINFYGMDLSVETLRPKVHIQIPHD